MKKKPEYPMTGSEMAREARRQRRQNQRAWIALGFFFAFIIGLIPYQIRKENNEDLIYEPPILDTIVVGQVLTIEYAKPKIPKYDAGWRGAHDTITIAERRDYVRFNADSWSEVHRIMFDYSYEPWVDYPFYIVYNDYEEDTAYVVFSKPRFRHMYYPVDIYKKRDHSDYKEIYFSYNIMFEPSSWASKKPAKSPSYLITSRFGSSKERPTEHYANGYLIKRDTIPCWEPDYDFWNGHFEAWDTAIDFQRTLFEEPGLLPLLLDSFALQYFFGGTEEPMGLKHRIKFLEENVDITAPSIDSAVPGMTIY